MNISLLHQTPLKQTTDINPVDDPLLNIYNILINPENELKDDNGNSVVVKSKDYDEWKNNFSNNPDVQSNIFNILNNTHNKEKFKTKAKNLENWQSNILEIPETKIEEYDWKTSEYNKSGYSWDINKVNLHDTYGVLNYTDNNGVTTEINPTDKNHADQIKALQEDKTIDLFFDNKQHEFDDMGAVRPVGRIKEIKVTPMPTVTWETVRLEDKKAQRHLTTTYSKYGFRFGTKGWGNNIQAYAENGNTEEFDFNNLSRKKNKEEAKRMDEWLQSNKRTVQGEEMEISIDRLLATEDEKVTANNRNNQYYDDYLKDLDKVEEIISGENEDWNYLINRENTEDTWISDRTNIPKINTNIIPIDPLTGDTVAETEESEYDPSGLDGPSPSGVVGSFDANYNDIKAYVKEVKTTMAKEKVANDLNIPFDELSSEHEDEIKLAFNNISNDDPDLREAVIEELDRISLKGILSQNLTKEIKDKTISREYQKQLEDISGKKIEELDDKLKTFVLEKDTLSDQLTTSTTKLEDFEKSLNIYNEQYNELAKIDIDAYAKTVVAKHQPKIDEIKKELADKYKKLSTGVQSDIGLDMLNRSYNDELTERLTPIQDQINKKVNSKVDKVNAKIKKIQINAKTTKEEYDEEFKYYKILSSSAVDLHEKLDGLITKEENIKEFNRLIQKDYRFLPNLTASAARGGLQIAEGLIGFSQWGTEGVIDVLIDKNIIPEGSSVDILSKGLNEGVDWLRNKSKDFREGYLTDQFQDKIQFSDISSFGDGLDWMATTFMEWTPQMVLMSLSMGGSSALGLSTNFAQNASLGLLSMSAIGNSYLENKDAKTLYGRTGGLHGYNLTPTQMLTNSFLKGGTEFFFERFTFGQVKRFNNFFSSKARLSFSQALKRPFYENFKYLGGQYAKGGTEEFLTELFNNFGDIAVGKKIHWTDNLDSSFAAGSVISFGLTLPQAGTTMLSPFQSIDSNQKMGRNFDQIKVLFRRTLDPNMNPILKESYNKQIADLLLKNEKILAADVMRVDLLNDKEKKNLFEIEKQNHEHRKTAEIINDDDTLTPKQKEVELEKLQNKVNENNITKDKILEQYNQSEVEIEYEKHMEVIDKNIEQVKKKGVEIELEEGDNKNFVQFQEATDVNEVEFDDGTTAPTNTFFNGLREGLKNIIKDTNSIKREIKNAKIELENVNKIIKNRNNIIKGRSNQYGAITLTENGFKIFVNKDKAIKKGVVSTGSHEFFHALLYATLLQNQGVQMAFGKSVLKELQTGIDTGYVKVKKNSNINERIKAYRPEEGLGEEVMTIVSEAIINDEITFNDSIFNNVGKSLRRFGQRHLGTRIKFNEPRDVFNFLRDYSETIKSGKVIDKALMDVFVKGGRGKMVPKRKTTRPPDVQLSKDYQDAPTVFNDKFSSREKTVINNFARNKDGSWMTKQEWDNKGFINAASELYKSDDGIFDNLLKKGIDIDTSNPNVHGVRLEEFLEDVKLGTGKDKGLLGVLQRFNPENPAQIATKNLSGWINGQVNFRKGDVSLRYKKRPTGKSVDAPIMTDSGEFLATQMIAEKEVDIAKFEEQIFTQEELETAPKKFIDTVEIKQSVKNKIIKTVGKADINLKDITYKGVKKLLTGKKAPLRNILTEISDLFGVPAEKIINNKDLDSKQRKKAQDYIEENSSALIDMLPEGMTAGGKATGVAPTLLKPFYTKQERVSMAKTGSKQGLPAQVKNKNIDLNTFRDVFGIKETDANINNKSVDGSIRALITQAAMITANQSIRENAMNHNKNPFDIVALVGDGKSELMFAKDPIFDNKLNSFTVEQARNLINYFGTANYNKLADTMNPQFVNLVEQIALNQNRNLGQGKKYQVGVSNLKSTPDVIKNFITKGGTWRGPKLFDDAGNGYGHVNKAQVKYVNQAVDLGSTFHPDILSKDIAFIYGIKDSGSKPYNNRPTYSNRSINPKAHPEAIIKLNKDREQNRKRENKLCRDNNIEFEYFKHATPMVFKGRVKKIITDIKSQNGLINKINKLKEYTEEIQKINRGNEAVLKYTALKTKMAYQNNKFSDINVFHFGKFQTNIVEGTRSLSSLDWLYLTEENQTNDKGQLVDEKNEHVGASATTNTKISSYIYSNGMDMSIDMIGNAHKSFFGPKTLMNNYLDAKVLDPKTDKMIDNKVSLEGAFRLTKFAGTDRRNIFHITADVDADGVTQNDAADWITKNENIIEIINDVVVPKYSIDNTIAKNMLQFSKDKKDEVKGISVLDFDDTLATTKSKVLYTAPDGTKGNLNAEEYAKDYVNLAKQGYKFDFSEFNKVIGAKTAPLFNKALKLAEKFGTDNMFVLTARPAGARQGIYKFLRSQGLNIPLKNITGLGNSTAEAKALWVAEKVNEGYNDFYFADDALPNVQAVDNILEQFDVKRKVQQAKLNFSKEGGIQMDSILDEGARDLDLDFNIILEQTKGVAAKKEFSAAKARIRGNKKNKFKFFIPPSAEDFVGLSYSFFGKGKQGETHHKFFKDNLFDPYGKGIRALNLTRQTIANEVRALKKAASDVKKTLKTTIPRTDYTYEHAARVYLWDKNGYDIPGLTKTDKNKLISAVKNNHKLNSFIDSIDTIISKRVEYPIPDTAWVAGSISYDVNEAMQNSRTQFLSQWLENKDIIFSEKNLNKIESTYGSGFRNALEDILWRMESGTNRRSGQNAMVNNFMDWINGSIGATMFVNMRSAVLQTLSTVNFINWHDNNVFKAASAFANQKQFWTDFSMIFNSNWLKQRRTGLQHDVNANEMIQAIAKSKNPVRAAIGYILQKGFKPTQIMDSFAISMGGASMYRNRIKTYTKQGLNQKAATDKAFIDLQEVAEETQQSARPDRISGQQASVLGKLILAFQNTPMQYMRLTKKAALDLINGRGDWKANISKIVYYSTVQNIIFYSMQSALFALAFGDDEDEEKWKDTAHKKKIRTINGMLDTVLRGSGIAGAVVSTLKNMVITFMNQEKNKYQADHAYTLIEMLNLSPPIGIKARKLYGATQTWEFNRDVIKYMSKTDIDNPLYNALFGFTEATTNIPLSRAYNKMKNVREALDSDNKTWQRVALFLGWNRWDLGIQDDEIISIKKEISEIKKIERKKKKLQEKYPGKTEKEIIRLEKGAEIYKYNKSEQVKTLLDLGLNKEEIGDLKKEEDRVNKILELHDDDSTKVDSVLISNKGYIKPVEEVEKKEKEKPKPKKKKRSEKEKEEDKIKKKKEKKIEKEKEIKETKNKFIEDQKKEREEGGSEEAMKCAAMKKGGERCGKTIKKAGAIYCTIHEQVEQSESGEKIRCSKIKNDGKQCKMKTNNKSGLCYYHD